VSSLLVRVVFFACLFVCLFVCLVAWSFVRLAFACLFVCLLVCLFVCLLAWRLAITKKIWDRNPITKKMWIGPVHEIIVIGHSTKNRRTNIRDFNDSRTNIRDFNA
jgi:hypothetical protein